MLTARSRTVGGRLRSVPKPDWENARTAFLIIDMWDLTGLHHCRSATRRIEELAPAIERLAGFLRDDGALVIHAPSECMDYYSATEPRRRASHATHHDALVEFGWNWPDTDREPVVPGLIWAWEDRIPEMDRCSCDAGPPSCITREPVSPTRQTSAIGVDPRDAITDQGQEIFNLLRERGIEDVVVTGVHGNICVLSRDFGIRQLVRLGLRPVLCRDLTDSFHRHPAGHEAGNDLVVQHIERFWCPTIESHQLFKGGAVEPQ